MIVANSTLVILEHNAMTEEGTATKECPFCGETIKATAKKCRYCGEFLDGYTREQVLKEIGRGDTVAAQVGDNVSDAAIGKDIQQVHAWDINGPVIQAKGDVMLGESQRDKQYTTALNWDHKTRMRDFDLQERDLGFLDFSHADLSGANFHSANLGKANLNNANLSGANLSGANVSGAELNGADLSGANLSGAELVLTNLRGAGLFRADVRADLNGANLNGADLKKADLRGANLFGADLRKADLRGANLGAASLLLANLGMANLNGADLSTAKLGEVDLSGEDPHATNLRGAKYDKFTKWPGSFDPDPAGAVLWNRKCGGSDYTKVSNQVFFLSSRARAVSIFLLIPGQ